MTSRRCLLAGLLVVALALAGCGGDDRASGPSCERADAAFDEPATRLTFRIPGADAGQMQRTRRILCARLAAFGVDHRVQAATGGALTVDVPRASELADRPRDATIFGVGRLAIYDWEANVIGPDGAPAPGDPAVTGGPGAGHAGALSLYDAVRRAARRAGSVEADNSRVGSLFYATHPESKQVYAQSDSTPRGATSRAEALAAAPASLRGRARVYEVKPDTVIVGAEQLSTGESVGSWYVLRDDVALRGTQIVNPQQRHDEGPGATGEPVVTFEFTAAGATAWQRLTRQLADRGSRGAATENDTDANQHFAIVVDDELLTVPYVDFRRNPEGIDARAGSQISGGFTIASARQLAVLLAGDALSAPLELTASRAAP
jgi:SecD/SecF fusion protein